VSAITTHLDDLVTVLRTSADLRPSADRATQLRAQVAFRLDADRPDLAARIRSLDDWHAEALADFLAEARVMAEVLEAPPPVSPVADDTPGR
jgi:hypothetical protein